MSGDLYSNLNNTQQEWYVKIVQFGQSHGFSSEDINLAVSLAYVESGFDPNAESGTGAEGLFQYTGGSTSLWVDITSGTLYSADGQAIYTTLGNWGCKTDPSTGNLELSRNNPDDQIAVFYAELKQYEQDFNNGVNFTAYNAALESIPANDQPTNYYEKLALYIEATHHGSDNIAEVVSGWKKKMLSNVSTNLSANIGTINTIEMDTNAASASLSSDQIQQIASNITDQLIPSGSTQNASDWQAVNTSVQNIIAQYGTDPSNISVTGNSITITYTDPATYTINSDGSYTEQYTDPASGVVSTYQYDAKGNLLSQTDSDGTVTNNTYDSNNNLISSATKDADGSSDNCTYTYDGSGNLTSSSETYTDAKGNVTTTSSQYDSNGDLTKSTETDPDGSVTVDTYNYDSNYNLTSSYETYTDAHGNVTTTSFQYANGDLIKSTENDPDGTVKVETYTYDSNDNLTSSYETSTDPGGEVTTISSQYDSNGDLVSQTTIKPKNENNALLNSYNNLGYYNEVVDPASFNYYDFPPTVVTDTYTYDSNGNLTSSTETSTSQSNDTWTGSTNIDDNKGDTVTCTSTYDSNGNVISKKYTDLNGWVTTYNYTYDSKGQLVSSTDGTSSFTYTYDSNGNLTNIDGSSVDGYTTDDLAYTYDSNGNKLTCQQTFTGPYSYDDWTIDYTFDSNGNIASEDTNWGGTGDDYTYYNYTYDASGNLLTSTETYAGSTGSDIYAFTYDTHGNVLTSNETYTWTDSTGSYPCTTNYTYTYDANGNMLTADGVAAGTASDANALLQYNEGWHETYDSAGNMLSYTYTYSDSLGQTSTENDTGTSNPYSYTEESTTYDANNNLISKNITVYSNLGVSVDNTAYTYDSNNNMISITETKIDTSGNVTTDVVMTTYQYNAQGQLVSETTPDGTVTDYYYDSAGNLASTTMTDASGDVTTCIYGGVNDSLTTKTYTDASGAKTTWQYNAQGQLTSETDPNGTVTSYQYNSSGELVTETATTSSGAQTVTSFTYDASGALTLTSAVQFDASGGITEIKYTNAQGQVTDYQYNTQGGITQETDPNGSVVTYQYDSTGLRTGATVTDSSGNITAYTYGANGAITVTYNDPTEYQYNTQGNLTSFTDPDGMVTTYQYNSAGTALNSETITDPAGDVLVYEYGSNGGVKEIKYTDAQGNTTDYRYGRGTSTITDPLGDVTTFTYGAHDKVTEMKYTDAQGYVTDYLYNDQGNLTQETAPDGTVTTYQYDSTGKDRTSAWITDTAGDKGEYIYGKHGEVESITYAVANDAVTNFQYDDKGNLTSETSISYQLDSSGNRTSAEATGSNGGVTDYTYNASDETTSIKYTGPSGAVTTYTYTYDANNELVSCSETDASGAKTTDTFTYDTNGNLTQVDTSNYDASGNLTSSIEAFESGNKLAIDTYDASGTLTSSASANETLSDYACGLAQVSQLVQAMAVFGAGESVATFDLTQAQTVDQQLLAQSFGSTK